MDVRQIPPTFAVYRGARAATLLVLGVVCVPAFASSSVTPCEVGARATQGLDVSARDLSVRTVDLGSASSVAVTAQPVEQPIESRVWASPSLTLTPRAESLLQQMFEEPQFSRPAQLDPLPARADRPAPIAEATTPLPGGDKIEVQKGVDTRIQSEDLGEISTRLPGVAVDELVRFKRRMYRTDI